MAELVDAVDSKSTESNRAGSSPAAGTTHTNQIVSSFCSIGGEALKSALDPSARVATQSTLNEIEGENGLE